MTQKRAPFAVYADETGTHGLKQGGKEPAPGIYGFLATVEHWDRFRSVWTHSLKKFDAPYFHFRELHPRSRSEWKCPYSGWDDNRVEQFKVEMAKAASSGPIPFGGNASIKKLYGGRTDKEAHLGAYEAAFERFFFDFSSSMDEHCPTERGTVKFFFESNDNKDWISILDRTVEKQRKRDNRIGAYDFVGKKTYAGMPCQAVDLFASLHRKTTENMYEGDQYFPLRFFDFVLSRHAYPNDHPLSLFAKYSSEEWSRLVNSVWCHQKIKESQDVAAGKEQEPYYPYRHQPFLRSIYQSLVLEVQAYDRKKRI